MIKGLVTVVLPIYNVEKYLDRCINSVVNQTYRNLEILLIDDGSTDNCPKMCDDWAAKDSRIRVIHKENQGLGYARNTGIDNSNGEYICFFDSDDYIDESTIEKAFNRVNKENADIVSFGINFVDENGVVEEKIACPLGDVTYKDKEVMDFYFPELTAPDPKGNGERLFYMSPCLMLYSTTLIEKINWRFVSEREIISEDVYSLLSLFKYVKKVAVISEAFYFYCRNNSSLSRSYRKDRVEKLNYFYHRSKDLCVELEYNDEIIHRVSKPYVAFMISALKQESVATESKKYNKNRIKELINDETLQDVLEANKHDNESIARKILFFAIRNRMHNLCYLLLTLKAKT